MFKIPGCATKGACRVVVHWLPAPRVLKSLRPATVWTKRENSRIMVGLRWMVNILEVEPRSHTWCQEFRLASRAFRLNSLPLMKSSDLRTKSRTPLSVLWSQLPHQKPHFSCRPCIGRNKTTKNARSPVGLATRRL